MTSKDHQAVVDIAKVVVNEYFDHYLTEVFPAQLDRLFQSHNDDMKAHPVQFKVLAATKKKVDRATWMIAGMSVLIAFAVTAGELVYYWYRH